MGLFTGKNKSGGILETGKSLGNAFGGVAKPKMKRIKRGRIRRSRRR